jgi:hypothetical protein
MRRFMGRRLRRYAITTVIAVAPIAIMCLYVTNLLVPTSPLPRPASYAFVPTATIDTSNETIGVADSDIWGLTMRTGRSTTTRSTNISTSCRPWVSTRFAC